jgi:hypothetical protein
MQIMDFGVRTPLYATILPRNKKYESCTNKFGESKEKLLKETFSNHCTVLVKGAFRFKLAPT